MKRRSLPGRRESRRLGVVVYCLCAVYLHLVTALLSWTLLPAAGGLSPTLIVSDSMSPRISAGDVLMLGKLPSDGARRGSVITFGDTARQGRLLTHRVVRRNADGTYTTRGDANRSADSAPVRTQAIRGVGRLVVPVVGAPAVWIREGNWTALLFWLGGSAIAFWYLRSFGRGRPRAWGWSAPLHGAPPAPVPPLPQVVPRGAWEPPLRPVRRVRWVGTAIVLLMAGVGAALPAALASEGAFSGSAQSPNNTLLAATSFCANPGPQTFTAVADAKVAQTAPTTNYGTATDLVVDGRTNRANRSLLRFNLPAPIAHCVMTATLRVYATAPVAGRTLEALQAASTWTEGAVTWDLAPLPTGTAATAVPTATPGWIEFTVTDQVTAMYQGSNTGFILKDQVESGGNGLTQTFSSREGATPPQLVLSFAPTNARPVPPSSLAATPASASRINLSWTDNSTNETGFIVQRSPAGASQWEQVAAATADTTAYTDRDLASATSYDYRVRATNALGASGASNIASATTLETPAAPPSAPTGLAVDWTNVNSIHVTWTDTSSDEDSFVIERSPAGAANWSTAGSVFDNVTSFEVPGLAADAAYDIRVRAVNNAGGSTWSNVVTAATGSCASAPAQTLISAGDASVAQGAPTTTLGTTTPTSFLTRSQTAANIRALVIFDAPSVPLGCSVASASLRLNIASMTEARTLQAWRAGGAWTEDTVHWNNQPAMVGTATTATSAVGWVSIAVTDHVLAQLSGSNDGFVIQDSVEDAGTTIDVNMSPKEGANPPQLVVTFGP